MFYHTLQKQILKKINVRKLHCFDDIDKSQYCIIKVFLFKAYFGIVYDNVFLASQVFDYDFGLQDDFMGSAFLDLTQLEINR